MNILEELKKTDLGPPPEDLRDAFDKLLPYITSAVSEHAGSTGSDYEDAGSDSTDNGDSDTLYG